MFWHILPHATVCIASDRPILLDTRQDRYLMVPEPIDRQLRDWLEGSGSSALPEAVAQLLEHSDVLREGDDRPINSRPLDVAIPPTLAAEPTGHVSGRPRDTARVSALVASTWLALRWKPLRKILGSIERRQTPGNSGGRDDIPAAAAVYDRARTYVPFARRCLLDSLALQAWLRRHHEHCQLVFGVTGQPFAAHCWLQNDRVILNDTYERVSRFTPILTI
ncbi:MAG: hypothetical protein JWR80_2038 [Bradyrhizobium sp.]|nr:hypothetical protein [Bradyrhizobium sp.]